MVTTLAGGTYGTADGTGTNAKFNSPTGLAISGAILYVADLSNHAIRVVNTGTAAVTTLAGVKGTSGTDDGTGTIAKFDFPRFLAISDTSLYVSDDQNHAIRVVNTGTGAVTTLAGVKGTSGTDDGTGTNAKFSSPSGLAISGAILYVADHRNHAIRVVNTGTGAVTTLAGVKGTSGTDDGTGTYAKFNKPRGLAISDTSLYVSDYSNQAIRVVNTGTAAVTTLAGGIGGTYGTDDGTGTNARFYSPSGLAISGTSLYVADLSNHAIRVVNTGTGAVTTIAGVKGTSGTDDGTGTNARFNAPAGLLAISDTSMYVSEINSNAIRLINFP